MAIMSLDEAIELVKNEDGILGTNSESEISEDNSHGFIYHDSDWASELAMAKV